jgi:hypothetical protein
MAGGHRPPPPQGSDTVSTVPAAGGPGRWRWGYPDRQDLAGPGGWHRARPHGGPGAVAEVTSPGACQAVPQVARRGWGGTAEFRPAQRPGPLPRRPA